MEVDANEVLRVVLQFLVESGLEKTARTLESEADVRLNVVPDVTKIGALIEAKDWATLLSSLNQCQLPRSVMWSLYEEILADLVERGEEGAAKEILRDSEDLEALKKENGARFDELQNLLLQLLGQALAFRGELDRIEANDKDGDEGRKRKDSKKRKRRSPSLFSGSQETLAAQLKRARKRGLIGVGNDDIDAKQLESGGKKRLLEAYAKITMGQDVTLNAACISWDGKSIATGTADGFIEIYDLARGFLRKDLVYQQENDIMMHKKAVLGLDWSRDGKYLASSSLDGTVIVWDVASGKRVTRIKRAHGKVPVNCVRFSSTGNRIVTGGGDHTVRIFSAETGNAIQTLRGPQAQVNAVCFVAGDDAYVAAGCCAQDKPSRICAAAEDGQLYIYDWASRGKDSIDLASADVSRIRASAPEPSSVPLRSDDEQELIETLGLVHSPIAAHARVAAILAGGRLQLLRDS
ncbi:WD40 repeat-containing protein SMU1 [Hondaea fermentalgiana]|uniref:WD40 repeat-containing protein SMU1 n=1 Tax=Hondaea fermentalgiana TaxID=2315210 RepID=A0A2R5GL15_9STRA|nr:WD40 repeat-containing protein SMU1 [Hondaea fermentalgiana]|eukprot:GBG29313.1 WD40 repeat-containing protein SMU1 [Hondaea fermentalgiana]